MPITTSTSSVWPLPSTPAMPSTSPRWICSETSSSSVRSPAVTVRVTSTSSSISSSVTVDSSVFGEGSSEPTISSASWCAGHLCRAYRGDGGAAPDDGDVVGDGEHLVELVRDEDQGVALLLELAEVREQRVDLLRHQDGGRLVEDDHLGAAVEHLQDLHPLPLTDPEALDELVGIEAEAVGARDLLDAGTGPVADAVQLLRAEHDVLEDAEVVGQHEVLEHHADAELDGLGGRAHRRRLAVDLDRAVVGLLHAVQDLHQRGLAGAVLAHDRVHGGRLGRRCRCRGWRRHRGISSRCRAAARRSGRCSMGSRSWRRTHCLAK